MRYDPERHHRRSIRLKGHDYCAFGAYYFTLCVAGREHLLGDVVEGCVLLSAAGLAVQRVWEGLAERFFGLELDAIVLMPNHGHAIVWLTERTGGRVALSGVVGALKSLSARAANRALDRGGRFWQRNYWERVIRGPDELRVLRAHIASNPRHWADDALYGDGLISGDG